MDILDKINEHINEGTYDSQVTGEFVKGDNDWQDRIVFSNGSNVEVSVYMSKSEILKILSGKKSKKGQIKIKT